MRAPLRWMRSLARRLVPRGPRPWELATMEEKFAAIFRKNTWNDPESVSGPGSSIRETAVVRKELPALIERLGVHSLLDVPCGDFHWMREISLTLDRYIGGDIVEPLIETNRRQFGNPHREFVKLDLTRDRLPCVDLVLCRDCLVHFSFADIQRALENLLRSGSTYLLTTVFAETRENEDILTGQWRRLDPRKPPFGFPEPIQLINERCPKEGCADKSLGLWRLADLAQHCSTCDGQVAKVH